MLVVVDLAADAFVDPGSSARLAELAARVELVLVCPAETVLNGVLARLRAAIPRHRVVGVLVEGEPSPIERELVDDLLNAGAVPLIMTLGDGAVDGHRLGRWLRADLCLHLPDPTPANVPHTRPPQPSARQ